MTEIQAIPGPSDAARLAEENQRLLAENQQLKTEQQARQAAAFLTELRAGGQLTPAMEQAGLAQALTVAANQPAQVSLPGGRTLPLSDVLREVLRTLPALCPQAGSALAGLGQPGAGAGAGSNGAGRGGAYAGAAAGYAGMGLGGGYRAAGYGGYGYPAGAPFAEPRYGLSPTEREVAAKLGLSEQEYAEIKSAQ
jgi:hypothetical protein